MGSREWLVTGNIARKDTACADRATSDRGVLQYGPGSVSKFIRAQAAGMCAQDALLAGRPLCWGRLRSLWCRTRQFSIDRRHVAASGMAGGVIFSSGGSYYGGIQSERAAGRCAIRRRIFAPPCDASQGVGAGCRIVRVIQRGLSPGCVSVDETGGVATRALCSRLRKTSTTAVDKPDCTSSRLRAPVV